MTGLDSRRPKLQTKDTFKAARLSGTLSPDGIAALHPEHPASSNGNGIAGVKGEDDALGFTDVSASAQSDDGGQDEDDELLESYDDLRPDPDTLISTRRSVEVGNRPTSTEMGFEEGHPTRRASAAAAANIQVRLERTGKQGHYILTADDPDLKDVLRKRLEWEEAEAGRGKHRTRFRDLVFTRQCSPFIFPVTTFDRRHAATRDSPFFGFFTLFWICMVLTFFQLIMKNLRDSGSLFGGNQVAKLMFNHDVVLLGLTDGVMYAATFEGLVFQKLVQKGFIDWSRSGWIIQNLWQTTYLAAVIGFSYFREWPWTHTIFVTLHGLVFVMKQHSYAFYNGHLSGVYKRRVLLERKLKELEAIEPVQSASNPDGSNRISQQFSSTGAELHPNNTATRRSSASFRTSTNLISEQSEVAAVASALASKQPITAEQMTTFSTVVKHEIDELTKELDGKSENGKNAYPRNLTFANMADWSVLPTLVYELEYPRQEEINWAYVAEKTAATFGVLAVMQVVSQAYIYPSVAATIAMKESGMTLQQRWQEFPFIVSDMLFPLLIEQLLTWYLIWECILNVLAELTRFADRGFYGDWWNSVTWDQYARDWNRPVHNFLLRHVYHSSISTFQLSRKAATFVTFLLSALVHEMCMALIFNKVRGYLFWMQLMQMPLVAFSRSKFMKDRTILGNVVFWVGLFIGPSVLTSLYLIV